MGWFIKIFVVLVLVVALNKVHKKLFALPPIPHFDPDQYWGPGEKPDNVDTSIREFKIDVPNEVLVDLKERLEHIRPFVPPLEDVQQQYGMNTNLLKEIMEFWKNEYNWTERQDYLNQYPQYKTNIQGLDVHFIHAKPENPGNKKVYPLLIIHGWPSSLREFYDIIPLFTNPNNNGDFVFEVITPHIPGFGFSQAASKPGLGANQMAVVMNNLMQRLGFKQYFCQGGDFGALILQRLSVLYPENVLGYHTHMARVETPLANIKYILGSFYPPLVVRPDHVDRVYPLLDKIMFRLGRNGYLHIQRTKPDTMGIGFTQSPAGLGAYILEKFTSGTNPAFEEREDGGLLEVYTYPQLLDNVMFYWITRSPTTSFRLYAETFTRQPENENVMRHPLQIPTAIARFRNDFYVPDGMIGEIFPNNVQLSDFEGGHFAAMENPKVLADDVFSAVEKFIKFRMMHPQFSEDLEFYSAARYIRSLFRYLINMIFG